jgi:hypothetical protein
MLQWPAWLVIMDAGGSMSNVHMLSSFVDLGGAGFALMCVENDMLCFALTHCGLYLVERSYRLGYQEGGGELA